MLTVLWLLCYSTLDASVAFQPYPVLSTAKRLVVFISVNPGWEVSAGGVMHFAQLEAPAAERQVNPRTHAHT